MAVTSLISPSGIVSPRPVETRQILPTRPDIGIEAPERTRTPEVRDLSSGLGPQEQRRIEILQNAERQRMRVEAEEAQRETRQAADGLRSLERDLVELRGLIQRSQDAELRPAQRSDLEQQAREMAQSVGFEIEINATDGPEIASISGVGFQPDTLGVVAVHEEAAREDVTPEEVRGRVNTAISRVGQAREAAQERLDVLPAPEDFDPPQRVEGIEVERERITTEQEAHELIEDIRTLQVEQGTPLILNLTTLGSEAVSALIP